MNQYFNSTNKTKRNSCDICKINTETKRVAYNHIDCIIKSACSKVGHHIHSVCIECEVSGKKLLCEKCGKFANSRISIREKLDKIFS